MHKLPFVLKHCGISPIRNKIPSIFTNNPLKVIFWAPQWSVLFLIFNILKNFFSFKHLFFLMCYFNFFILWVCFPKKAQWLLWHQKVMNQINANITTDFHPQIQVAVTLLLVPLLPVPLIPPTSTSCSFCSVSVREYSATSSRFPSAPAALRARRGSCSPWTFSKSEARPTATLWSWRSQQRLNKRAFKKRHKWEWSFEEKRGQKNQTKKKVRRAEVTQAAAGGLRCWENKSEESSYRGTTSKSEAFQLCPIL